MAPSDRVTAFVTCFTCDHRRKLRVHPRDCHTTITVGCPRCRQPTTHRVGRARWFK